MLPTEIPPDPSCSSNTLVVKTDEKVPEKLVFLGADPAVLEETPTPNFCIRDYVVASRSKDIKASWPFKLETLQFYVKHGIKDLLPPFGPPDLVRAQCTLFTCSVAEKRSGQTDVLKTRDSYCSNEQPASIGKDSCWSPEELVPSCLDQGKVDQKTRLDKKLHPSSSYLEDIEPSHKTKKLSEALEKKCRLVARLGAISDTNRVEDMVCNSSTVSDPMVSKVCPVCKTFSSTSNTTLNAHIDQCLSTESSLDKVINKFPKCKVKPMKKRLMVDIYTTAPSCTLEDLDKRNGTNWAVELALPVTPNIEVTDTKRLKLSQVEPTDEHSEGAVYIDSNGIKLRILSKFNDASSQDNDLKLQKHKKELTPDTSILIRKRRNISPKYSRHMKLKAGGKPLSSIELLSAKIPTTSEGDYCEENHQQTDERKSQLLVTHAKKSIWLTSKCSDTLKRQPNEVCDVTTERMICRKAILGDNVHLGPHNSTQKYKKKFSGQSEDLTGAPKVKRVDSLDAAAINDIIDRKRKCHKMPLSNVRLSSESTSSVNGLLLKFSRPSRNFLPSNSYPEDAVDMADGSSDAATQLNGKNNLKSKDLVKRSNFHFETNKVEATTETFNVLKKIRRHRSNLRTAKRGIEAWPPIDGSMPGTFKDLGPEYGKPLGSCQSSLSDNILHEPPNSSNDIQIFEGKEDQDRMQIAGCDNSNEKPPERAECHDHDEILDMENCPKLSSEIAVCDNSNENTENNQTTANTQFDPSPCLEDPECTLSGSEQQLERFEDQETLYGDASSNELGNQVREKEDEYMHNEVKKLSLASHEDCHINMTFGQDSGGCLTGHDDLELDLTNKSSSITSICQTENLDTNLRGEKELSESPVSTPSVVFALSPRETKSKDSEGDILSRTTFLEGKPGLVAPTESNGESEMGFYKRNGEYQNLPLNNPVLNETPCCCSCRESLSRDSQLPRQSDSARTVQAKMVPRLFIGPRISSSFSAYQSRRTCGVVTDTSLGSSSPIASTNNWQDASLHYATCSPSGSQSQNQSTTSSPVLRLMGKDLMVVNKDHVRTQAVTLEQPPNLNTMSPAFASTNNHFRQELLPYHHQFLSGSPASSGQALSDSQMPMKFPITTAGGFVGSSYNNSWIKPSDYQSQHSRQYKRINPLPASYSMNEVIVIDDNPENEAEFRGCLATSTNSLPLSTSGLNHLPQRLFACFPSQSYSGVPGAITPMFQNIYPGISASFANRGNIQAGQVSYLPNPLVFQSPVTGQMGSSKYYSQTMR